MDTDAVAPRIMSVIRERNKQIPYILSVQISSNLRRESS